MCVCVCVHACVFVCVCVHVCVCVCVCIRGYIGVHVLMIVHVHVMYRQFLFINILPFSSLTCLALSGADLTSFFFCVCVFLFLPVVPKLNLKPFLTLSLPCLPVCHSESDHQKCQT